MSKCNTILKEHYKIFIFVLAIFSIWTFSLLCNLCYNRWYFEIKAKISGFGISVKENKDSKKIYFCRPYIIVNYKYGNKKYKNALLLHEDIIEYDDDYEYEIMKQKRIV